MLYRIVSYRIAERHAVYSPKVTEPLDQLRRVVLVELDVREVIFEHCRAWIPYVEEHQFGLAKMHRCQRTGVKLPLLSHLSTSKYSDQHRCN